MSGVQREVVLGDPDTDIQVTVNTSEQYFLLRICEYNVSIEGGDKVTALEQTKHLIQVLSMAVAELERR